MFSLFGWRCMLGGLVVYPRGGAVTRPRRPTVPGGAPRDVKVLALDSRSLLVSWKPPPVELQNGAIRFYALLYRLRGQNQSEETRITLNNPALRNFTIDELHKYAEYVVRVLAGTGVGDGPASRAVFARTQEDGTYPEADELSQ